MDVAANLSNTRSHTLSPDSRDGEELAKRMLEAVKLVYSDDKNAISETSKSILKKDDSTQRELLQRVLSSSTATPVQVVPQVQKKEDGLKLCRIYDMDAIKVPGVLYKTVGILPSMSSQEVITEALEKFGSFVDPSSLELRYAPDPDRLGAKEKKKKKMEPPKVVRDEDCPLLVVEWYTDIPRRFEIHPKSEESEKLKKKWTEYWHSPGSFARGKSYRRQKTVKKSKSKSTKKK